MQPEGLSNRIKMFISALFKTMIKTSIYPAQVKHSSARPSHIHVTNISQFVVEIMH